MILEDDRDKKTRFSTQIEYCGTSNINFDFGIVTLGSDTRFFWNLQLQILLQNLLKQKINSNMSDM